MKSTKHRRFGRPHFECLEGRKLLSTATAVWIGQAEIDTVGPWAELRPSTIQDIRIRLESLPADRTITRAVVQGHGADRWEFGGPAGSWLANLSRSSGATTADLFIEPLRQESGREFSVTLTFDDGSVQEIYFPGGFADPNLRMPGEGVRGSWLGAAAEIDLTSPSASVGPDGVTDFQLRIERLDPAKSVQAIDIVDAEGQWVASYGENPSRVGTLEFSPDSTVPGSGVLTFSKPNRQLAGPITIQVTYRGGSKDSTTVAIGSTATAPVTLPGAIAFRSHSATASWLGQVVSDPYRPGWIRVAVNDLPVSGIYAWQISDRFGQNWLWTISGQGSPWATVPETKSLVVSQDSTGRWFLEFDSRWDQASETLSIMAAADNGRFYRIDLAGGPVDTTKRNPMPASTEIVAAPGANLQALVDTYGTVRLTSGVYRLSEPLVLRRPVNLIGSEGSILEFAQPANSPGWSTVIKLAAGNVKLSGFEVRFDGPVKWLDDIRYGPAVIGSPDNFDTLLGRVGAMPGIVIEGLNIIGPRPNFADEEAPRMIRLIDDVSGRVEGNTFFGGLIEMTGGPWTVAGNRIEGTWQGSFSYDAFAFHDTRGLVLRDNHVIRGPNSGPIMRLLVINGDSRDIVVSGNTVIGMGARYGDSPMIQELNAHEVILTEAYHVSYEGALLGIDATRRIVRIHESLGRAYRPGDTLAVLSGSDAGSYRTVVAVVDGTTLILDAPLPQWVGVGTAVSVNRGIANIAIHDNMIDQTERPQSRAIVMVGNLYDLSITDNRIFGGFRGFQITAYPSESPRDWGWTRNVVFDAAFTGNEMTDVLWFNQVGVSHNSFARANFGHLYLTAELTDNVFRWSERFLIESIWQQPDDAHLVLPGLELGEGGKWDDTEARVALGENFIDLPAGWSNRPAAWIRSGSVNGRPAAGEVLMLTPIQPLSAPSGLRLLHDSGISVTDRLTNDPRLRLDAVDGLQYEYRQAGATAWRLVTSAEGWVPEGLRDGQVVIEARAVDSVGRRGPIVNFAFVLDTAAPAAPTSLRRIDANSVGWSVSASADAVSQTIRLFNAKFDKTIDLAPAIASTSLSRWILGANWVEVSALDAAGNRSAAAHMTIDYTATGSWVGQDGSDYASLSGILRPDGKQDIRLDIAGLPFGTSVASLTVAGFGGGEWVWPKAGVRQYAAAWRPSPNGLAGSIHFQTNRREIGRPFHVTLRFADGSTVNFWVIGGTADPSLPATGTGESSGSSKMAVSGASSTSRPVPGLPTQKKSAKTAPSMKAPVRKLPRPIAIKPGRPSQK